jgi:hypothetical protein
MTVRPQGAAPDLRMAKALVPPGDGRHRIVPASSEVATRALPRLRSGPGCVTGLRMV